MSLKNLGYSALCILFIASLVLAQGPAKLRNEQPPLPVDEIIRKFAEKEKEFKAARANYVYRQDIRVQTLNANDRVTGEWRQVWDVTFDQSGRRVERVISAPPDTLKGLQLTSQDLQDFREIQPFVLTADDIGKYSVKYLGKEAVDDIDCYVFDVAPKTMEKGQRYFQGQIWVDDKDLQIVKTYGKPVPDIKTKDNENLFPRFETYREQIDGKYWFPTYTRAVDTLQFSAGAQRMREIIKYDNYRQFQSNVKLTFGDAVDGGKTDSAPSVPDDNKAAPLDPRLKQPPAKKK
jgi:hypothetical protein